MTGRALAIVVVREGWIPAGAKDVAIASDGRVLLVGTDVRHAAVEFTAGREVWCLEVSAYTPATVAAALASVVGAERLLLLPASPDGRDLAPRLASTLKFPLFTNAVRVTTEQVVCVRDDERVTEYTDLADAAVVTLVPGHIDSEVVTPAFRQRQECELAVPEPEGVQVLGVRPPEPPTVDLAGADRVVVGGLGLRSAEAVSALADLADRIGATIGSTGPVSERGWLPTDRQIGSAGAAVNPALYLAFGVSGAPHHLDGIGQPRHMIAVNSDPRAPVMARADLALLADAADVLREVRELLQAQSVCQQESADLVRVVDG